jgi:hypothetical protein
MADDRFGSLSTDLSGPNCRSVSASARKRSIGQSLIF